MTSKKKRELVETLINEKINETLARWSDNPDDLKCYAWGWRGKDTLGPNHNNVFHCCDDVAKLLTGLGLSWYLVIRDNEDGEPTPCIIFHVF